MGRLHAWYRRHSRTLPWRWVEPEEVARYAMPRGNRKIIENLESETRKGGPP